MKINITKEQYRELIIMLAIANGVVGFIGDTYRVLQSKKTANVYKVYWNKGKYFKEVIPVSRNYLSLNALLAK